MEQRKRDTRDRYPYQTWMEQEGIPIVDTVAGTDDLAALPRKPWARTGGSGTFVQMLSTKQAERGLYVAEIPGGKALNPEKHLYQEAIVILKGRGVTEVWQEGEPKRTFEWGEGSVFAPPRNCWHRLLNGTREPALFLGVTTAPKVMSVFGPHDFIFNCNYKFQDHFDGKADYFTPTEDRQKEGRFSTIWYTNFIPDAKAAFLDNLEQKVAGGRLTGYRMADGFPYGHVSEWPAGRYHKAHYHGPGAILVGLLGEGYVLVWPRDVGTRPYAAGAGDKVLKINWGPRSIYTPPDGWFHQHLNTSNGPARHLAIYGGNSGIPGYTLTVGEDFSGYISIKEGGTLIDYEDEDPQIRKDFAGTLRQKGLELKMPPVSYRQ